MRAFAGTGRMIRLQVRTAPLSLIVTVLAIAGTTAAVMSSIAELYDTAAQRALYAATLGASPATAAINGRGFDLDTLGGIAAYEVGFFALLLLPAVVLLQAIRATRAQEDLGRYELISAMRVGRLAPLLSSVLLLAVGIVLACGLAAWVALQLDYESSGTIRYFTALALFFLVIAGFGFVCAEVGQSARTASGLAFGGLLLTYLLRALIDGNSWDAGWTTPMGWLALARPYSPDPPIWPYLALGACALLLGALALTLRARRDLGAGLIAPRPGPVTGKITRPAALIGQITVVAMATWGGAAAAWGLSMGMLAEEMQALVQTNPLLAQALAGETDSPGEILSFLAVALVAVMACAFGVQAVGRCASEETAGRLGVVFSTSVSRTAFWIRAFAVITAEAMVVLAVGALGYGLAAMATGMDWAFARDALEAGAGYAAPVVATLGLAIALYALAPRLAGLAWLLPLWSTVVLVLGETLQLPEWARNLSPMEWPGMLPVESVDGAAWVVLVALGLVAMAGALPRLRHRDLAAG